jgi:hypothetical protein
MTTALKTFLIFGVIGMFESAVSGQEKSRVECPATRVIASAPAVTDGDKVSFQVELTGGNVDRSRLEYHWIVNAGRIVSGQGTPVVFVSTSGEGSVGSVAATIDISPYRDCEWFSGESIYVRRKGPRTNADMFWEWMWFNGAKVQYAEVPENADIEREIRERLDQIDPRLTLEIGPRGKDGKRDLIVGYSGKNYDSKAVAEFIARAPNSVIFNLVFKNSLIDPK